MRSFVLYTFKVTGRRDIVTEEITRDAAAYAAAMQRAPYRYGDVHLVVLPDYPTVSLAKDSDDQTAAFLSLEMSRLERERLMLKRTRVELDRTGAPTYPYARHGAFAPLVRV